MSNLFFFIGVDKQWCFPICDDELAVGRVCKVLEDFESLLA